MEQAQCLTSGFQTLPMPQQEEQQLLELLLQHTLRQAQHSEQFITIAKYPLPEAVAEQPPLQQQR